MRLKSIVSVVFLAIWLASVVLLAGACFSTPRQVGLQDRFVTAGTNAIVMIQRDVVPLVPQPYQAILEGGLAVGTGLLAVWARSVHKRLQGVQGSSGTSVPGTASTTVQTRPDSNSGAPR